MRILIVEDNKDTADSLANLLRIKGHETSVVYNAYKALETAKPYKADIVLLDIGLPDIDGYELVKRLRADDVHSIFVALTGYGEPEDIEKALDSGFDAHITKPIELDELEHIFGRFYMQ